MEKSQNELYNALVGVFLGVVLSFFLSFVGTLQSGHFSVVALIVSFMCSSILSIIIGIFVPIKRITDSACRKANVKIEGFGGRCLAALIGDLIFTPFMASTRYEEVSALSFFNFKYAFL